MTVNERVLAALGEIAPVYPDLYEGEEREYIVFTYSEVPQAIGEGTPTDYVCLLAVHYCAPHGKDTVETRNRIAAALASVGFTWPSIMNVSDEDGQQYMFECEGLRNGQF